jgi:hypothetical protein
MGAIFSPCVGAVAKVPGCSGDSLFAISFGGATLTAPITGFVLELNGNYQFLHTVNDFIYVYAFGDRIGELTVSGIGFVKTCASAESAKLCNVFDFYQANRLKVKGNLTVTIGDCSGAVFWAFLTGMRMELQDPQTLIGQWSLRFNVLPKK